MNPFTVELLDAPTHGALDLGTLEPLDPWSFEAMEPLDARNLGPDFTFETIARHSFMLVSNLIYPIPKSFIEANVCQIIRVFR